MQEVKCKNNQLLVLHLSIHLNKAWRFRNNGMGKFTKKNQIS